MYKSRLDWREGLVEAASENPRKGEVRGEEEECLDMKSEEDVVSAIAIALCSLLSALWKLEEDKQIRCLFAQNASFYELNAL